MTAEHHDARTVARGAFINLIGNLGKLSHFAFDLFATRWMGAETFGYFSTTWLIINLSFLICYFGAHRLIIDFVAKSKAHGDDEHYRGVAAYLILVWMLSLGLVGFFHLFGDDIAAAIGKPPVGEYLRILSWAAPFYCMTTIFLSATRGLKIMKLWVFVRNGVEPLVDLIAILAIFLLTGLHSAPVAAKSIGFAIGGIVSIFVYRRYFEIGKVFRLAPRWQEWKHVLHFGLPVTFADFLSIVILKIDIIVLSVLSTASQVAVFQVIINIANTMRNIPQAVDPIMMPMVVEMRITRNYASLEKIYASVIRASLFLSAGFVALSMVFGHLLLGLYGEAFVYGTTALTLACAGIMLHTISSSIEPVLIMSGFPYLNLANNITFVLVNLVCDVLWVPSYGIVGAGMGCLAASVVTASLQIGQLYVKILIRPIRKDMWRAVAMAAVYLLVFESLIRFQPWGLPAEIVLFIVFLLSYLYIGWRWVFDEADRSIFSVIFKRPGTQ